MEFATFVVQNFITVSRKSLKQVTKQLESTTQMMTTSTSRCPAVQCLKKLCYMILPIVLYLMLVRLSLELMYIKQVERPPRATLNFTYTLQNFRAHQRRSKCEWSPTALRTEEAWFMWILVDIYYEMGFH